MDFYPVVTEDGSISLYNTKVKDIYHSKIGAYSEAVLKFVKPSGILDFVACNNEVKILDICYGLGYNSKAAVAEIRKVNNKCNICITALEIDPYVLAYSTIIDSKHFNKCDNETIDTCINSIINVTDFQKLIADDVNFFSPIKSGYDLTEHYLSQNSDNSSSLHNIYYRSLSDRNNNLVKSSNRSNFLEYKLIVGDARQSVLGLNEPYDFIFHDGFTPSRLPTLWTKEFFMHLYRLLKVNGNLTTYSSSAAVRSGLLDAGFYIGSTDPIGRKSAGTIAYKNNSFVIHKLSDIERGLLDTKSGIPYYDNNLINTADEILSFRENLVDKSNKISASHYYKNINHC